MNPIIITLIVLAVLGESSIRAFVIPLIVGVVAGTYSSIFIAAPLWVSLKKEDKVTKQNSLKK